MSIHVVGIIGLVVVFLVGTLRPINLGALALVMMFVHGTIFGQSVQDMYRGFPVDLFVLLAGVTYLFGVASNNGTLARIVEGMARLVGDRRALIPWSVFIVAALPTMAGALTTTSVALLTPVSLRLARRYDIAPPMMGLMVAHGAMCGNFSPLNVLAAVVHQALASNGLQISSAALFLANLAYNVGLGVIIYLVFGGLRFTRREPEHPAPGVKFDATVTRWPTSPRVAQVCTLLAIVGVAIAALAFQLNMGFLAFGAAALLHLVFPASSGEADKKIAWGVVLLICGVVTYVAALQRYGTIDAVGRSLAAVNPALVASLLICAVVAITSAVASTTAILGAMTPLAVPLMNRGEISMTGLVIALAISATVVDSTPFSTAGAVAVASAEDDERPRVYRGLLLWGAAMVVTAPLVTWLIFIVAAG
ncbi:MAG: C4-dicarboxylate transporter [Chloroflexi bacterium]|nr:C4-dicarboxylate transporter [Chloroflexota bacterium]